MKRSILSIIFLFILSFFMICFAAPEGMKLYRNTDYHFSLYIPNEFNPRTPRGPNVKMSYADEYGNNMNVIVKPVPGIIRDDEETMQYLLENQKRTYRDFSGGGEMAFGYLVDLPPSHKAVQIGGSAFWRTPDRTYSYLMTMVTTIQNNKCYTISYGILPEYVSRYSSKIKQSIASFTDETGW